MKMNRGGIFDWKKLRLQKVGKIITGNTPSTKDDTNYGKEYLFVSPADLDGVKYIVKTSKKLSRKGFGKSRSIKKDAVLYTCIGSTIGKLGIASCDLATNQQINSIVPFDNFYGEFIYYQLMFNTRKIRLLAGEQAVPLINKTEFGRIELLYPPLPEQQKIASILSTWDRAIEKQEALIAVKKEYKKGVMQQLLTGQQRFPGFTEEWEEVRLGDVADSFSGGTPSRKKKEYYGGSIPWIKSGELNARKIYRTEECITEVGLKESAAKMVEKNTLLIAMYGATAGVCAITKVKGAINQAVLAIVPNENIDMLFLFQLILSKMPKVVLNMVQGGQPNLSGGIINSIKLIIPTLSEQQKIASFLSALDKEIEVLENELEAVRMQKWGLMQQLLTGKIRVKM